MWKLLRNLVDTFNFSRYLESHQKLSCVTCHMSHVTCHVSRGRLPVMVVLTSSVSGTVRFPARTRKVSAAPTSPDSKITSTQKIFKSLDSAMMNRGERGGQSWVDKVVNYISRNANSEILGYLHPKLRTHICKTNGYGQFVCKERSLKLPVTYQ